METRGNKEIDDSIKQTVYDEWLENCIPSVDTRNNRECVNMSKMRYIKKYKGIVNKPGTMKEKKNKRGTIQYNTTRMMRTCTIRAMQKKNRKET